jgi:branched-chain amino acid aminotransferase
MLTPRSSTEVLWLLDGMVTEAGASNFFVVWRSREGKIQLVTAPLGDKIILDGVTRRSILQLARERLTIGTAIMEPIDIVERKFTMDDIVEAVEEGRIIEAFAAGTAVCSYMLVYCCPEKLTFNSTLYAQSLSSTTETET